MFARGALPVRPCRTATLALPLRASTTGTVPATSGEMRPTLDPKLDIVFKLLFADERNRHCLIALLTALLKPKMPILSVAVLNAETRRETVVDKGAILDLRLVLASGEYVHVEMQLTAHAGLRERGLYYWARVYTAQLHRGDSYGSLRPTIGIFILGFSELAGERYHSIFRLLERDDHTELTDALELHVVDLSKLPKGPPRDAEDPVLRWARFFAARNHTEREQLAMTDPDLHEAQRALQRLSEDPLAQQLAFDRELELNSQQYYLEVARRQAAEKAFHDGIQQGTDQGRARALKETLELLCRVANVELTTERRALLEAAAPDELQRILESVATRQVWPNDDARRSY